MYEIFPEVLILFSHKHKTAVAWECMYKTGMAENFHCDLKQTPGGKQKERKEDGRCVDRKERQDWARTQTK